MRHMIIVHHTETRKPDDLRADSPQFIAARKKEVTGLLDKGTSKVVLKEYIPEDSNVHSGRFVLAIKNKGTNEEIYKARSW